MSQAATDMPRRLGPRPLGLHLAMLALSSSSSGAALTLWRQGWLAWKPEVRAEARALGPNLASADPAELDRALRRVQSARLRLFADGVLAYRRNPHLRNMPTPPIVWSEGTTRLLDYRPEGGLPLLVVPSLVNRAYILDLTERRSLMRWLAGRGFRPLLVDWGRPEDSEADFTLTDYVAGRLDGALDAVRGLDRRAPAVLGYCMGGNLAVALALRRRRDIGSLVLMATPWDFHAGQPPAIAALPLATTGLGLAMDIVGELPTDVLQSLFFGLDPFLVIRKFERFARLAPDSERARDFIELEDWLNDGVPLVTNVARECLNGWYIANTPGKGRWRIAGRVVDPARIDTPTLILIPAKDRIVPPESALALARTIPRAEILRPPQGHIAMTVGASCERDVWRPLAAWLDARKR
ncbi:MAG: alpha/beta fold hydrolase [Alphaproteobacteria bacterium]|nr:alpha/beta fold hydrolase [Alphaproteobacteria bacterium]